MSTIRSLLAKQDAEFVSLRDLLNQMASEGGGTPQEAAQFLLRQIESVERETADWTPAWYKRGETGWNETSSKPWETARVVLLKIVQTGNLDFKDPSRQWEEMSDDIPF